MQEPNQMQKRNVKSYPVAKEQKITFLNFAVVIYSCLVYCDTSQRKLVLKPILERIRGSGCKSEKSLNRALTYPRQMFMVETVMQLLLK